MYSNGEWSVRRGLWPVAEDDEDRLWRAAVGGDVNAFSAVMERHGAQLSSIARRFSTQASDVEDVVQETYVRAFQHRGLFRYEGQLRAWMIRVVINLCRSRARGFWWKRIWLTDDVPEGASGGNPEHLAQQSLVQSELERSVRELPDRLRLPFTLRFFEELTGAEIAEVLGCTESTVWSRIYAARRELQRKLAGLLDS